MNTSFHFPIPENEITHSFAPGTKERKLLQEELLQLRSQHIDIPLYIGGKEIFTKHKVDIFPPHDLQLKIGTYSVGTKEHVQLAIDAALAAKAKWSATPWQERAQIFLKAADLVSQKWRYKILASTMLGQSKNAYQAEIDAACELADFLRFNVYFMEKIYNDQPSSTTEISNKVEYRPLEGFVFALTPFNFTAIAGNLFAAPALMGNTVVWKPNEAQAYSAYFLMGIFKEAGLPDGVINMVIADGPEVGEVIFNDRDFAGLHFTGSTKVFKQLWKTIGNNIDKYKTYPRIVGETGGKDFVMAHPSADVQIVTTALSRGAFEYQGQKCSAASRAYIPQSLWPAVKEGLIKDVASFKIGPTEDFENFVNAVIDKKAYDRIVTYIEYIKSSPDIEILIGGGYNCTKGYFIEPTVVLTTNPKYKTMREEIFGPVLTIYVYDDHLYEDTLKLIDETSEYALTGAIISEDRFAILQALKILEHAAGNIYINDKPTGAVVNQQPFGGARSSGTNDKAGSFINLLRWTSARTIKENLNPPKDYRYPFMEKG
ncbi:MAG: L-glutamate gamma-semialdehyde dehydrogenase [Bacteroidetes bacterium]|nr:L-glutamate gamma-semialdehyde dehydrogenase [Bacteroidota bacterium]